MKEVEYNAEELTRALTIISNDMINQQSPFTINVCDLPNGNELAITTAVSEVTGVLLTTLAGLKLVVEDCNLVKEEDIDDCLKCVDFIKNKLLEYKGE